MKRDCTCRFEGNREGRFLACWKARTLQRFTCEIGKTVTNTSFTGMTVLPRRFGKIQSVYWLQDWYVANKMSVSVPTLGGYRILEKRVPDTGRQEQTPVGGSGGILLRKIYEFCNGIPGFLSPSQRAIMSFFNFGDSTEPLPENPPRSAWFIHNQEMRNCSPYNKFI